MADQPNNQQPQSGMSVNVTPASSPLSSTIPPSDYSQGPKSNLLKDHKVNLKYIGVAAIIIIILVGVVVYGLPKLKPATTTSVSTTTAGQSGAGYLSSCQTVSSPGSYYLQGPIRTSNTNGACINVTSNNVAIVCNGQSISGSGPYTGIPPFSYGIYAFNRSNVSVTGCSVGNFSFGVYLLKVTGFAVSQDTLSHDYMSGLYLGASLNGQLSKSTFMNDSSPNGAVIITNGSTNITVQNNTLQQNAQYAFNLQSKGLRFYNNKASLSQSSFVCSGVAGFPQSSVASGNNCYNNTGCGFLECNGTNTATNLASLVLGYSVANCGSISNPGTYNLNQNLNIFNYVDPKLKGTSTAACLTVKTNNVKINCNGFSLMNASTAITATGVTNLTISNCAIVNATTGISLYSITTGRIMKTSIKSSSTGMWLANSGGILITNSSASGGTTGIQFNSTTASILINVTTDNNKLNGISLSNSLGNNFNSGISANNIKFDIFADNKSAASGDNLMSKYNCGVSDAVWATCTSYVKANFSVTPVTGCTSILHSGSYQMQNNLITTPSDCMTIKASSVRFNCSNKLISTSINVEGPAILVQGVKNVTLLNCNINGYDNAIQVFNSSQVTITNTTDNNTDDFGFTFSNVSSSVISNSRAAASQNASIYLNNVKGSQIINNNVTNSTGTGAAGMLVVNSSNNRISGNFGNRNNYGMIINGTSKNNTIVYNTFGGDKSTDYVCQGPIAGGIGAQNGGSNTGSTKSGCHWLAARPSGSLPLSCQTPTGAQHIIFSQDYVYPSNSTCYFIANPASGTTIDCNGHTVLAPNGGSFAWLTKSNNVTIENCDLKGFTTAIIVSGGLNPLIYNTTIYENVTNTNSSSASIGLYSPYGAKLTHDNVTTKYIGVYANNAISSLINWDTVNAQNTAFALYGMNSSVITNSTSSSSSGIGALLSNSVGNQFQNDNFYGVTNGLWCLFKSTNSSSNTDSGHISCTNTGCGWIGLSSTTCH